MNSHIEVKLDPQDGRLKDALDLLRKEGILNQEKALSEDDEEELRSFTQKIETFLLEHIEYVHIATSMIIIKNKAKDGYEKLLEGDVIEEIQWALDHNAQHVAPLALAKFELETTSALFKKVKEYIEPEFLIQHAEHAYGLVRAMQQFVRYKNMDETIKNYLVERAEYARKFSLAIDCLFRYGLLDSTFLTSKYVIFLDQCPPRKVFSLARAMCNLHEENMLDQDHKNMLLECKHPAAASTCMTMLKRTDDLLPKEEKGKLCSLANKLLIIRHPHVKSLPNLLWLFSKELSFNQHNFDIAIRYVKFSAEIKAFFASCKSKDKQAEFDSFIAGIDRAYELQRGPFLQGMRPVNASIAVGSFFRHGDYRNLCKKIFSYLPTPEIPIPKVEFKK